VSGKYTATKNGDCGDSNAAVNPGMIERCNLVDENCDGKAYDMYSLCFGNAQICLSGACQDIRVRLFWSKNYADGELVSFYYKDLGACVNVKNLGWHDAVDSFKLLASPNYYLLMSTNICDDIYWKCWFQGTGNWFEVPATGAYNWKVLSGTNYKCIPYPGKGQSDLHDSIDSIRWYKDSPPF
jgi:hypothetical protein